MAIVDIEFGAAGIFNRDPEGFEHEVGAAQVDVIAGESVDDFHERCLDRFFVFDQSDGMDAHVGRGFDAAQHALMEVAELFAAHGRATAWHSGDFDVLAGADVFEVLRLRRFCLNGRHLIWTSKNEIVFG